MAMLFCSINIESTLYMWHSRNGYIYIDIIYSMSFAHLKTLLEMRIHP